MLKSHISFLATFVTLAFVGCAGHTSALNNSFIPLSTRPSDTHHSSHIRPLCVAKAPDRAVCQGLLRTDIVPGSQPIGYTPTDLQSAYSINPSGGTGQTIAIVDAYNNPSVEYEIGRYRSYFGLPACTTRNHCFKKLNESGQQKNYPISNEGWAVEETLDTEMVSAICSKCHIELVEANTDTGPDLSIAESTAITAGATVVSNSWICDPAAFGGGCILDQNDFSSSGVILAAASGDNGYNGNEAFPAEYPSVVAVGGTTLQRATNTRGWKESAWSNTGGGTCTTQPKPTWQHDKGCAFRITNDASAVGDPNTGVAVFSMYFGGWGELGGTSASTPIIAAAYGLAGNAASLNAAQSLYSNRSQLHDITSGSNGQCSPFPNYFCNAVKGYDGPTGVGSPNGVGAF